MIQDVALLEKLIQDDISAAKTPVLIVAYAGLFGLYSFCFQFILPLLNHSLISY